MAMPFDNLENYSKSQQTVAHSRTPLLRSPRPAVGKRATLGSPSVSTTKIWKLFLLSAGRGLKIVKQWSPENWLTSPRRQKMQCLWCWHVTIFTKRSLIKWYDLARARATKQMQWTQNGSKLWTTALVVVISCSSRICRSTVKVHWVFV